MQAFDSPSAAPKRFIVVIPAYNEEATILDCLKHVMVAASHAKEYQLEKIVVCLNGCTDRTKELLQNWENGPLEIIESQPGYIAAMNTLFRYAKQRYPDYIMIKTDADGTVDSNAFSVLFDQLKRHEKLIIVGGHPVPLRSAHKSWYRRFMSSILSVRSRTPEAEVTVVDTSHLHTFDSDPIPELKGREQKLKIYFHGRLWCARSSKSLPYLPSGVIGDDVYLPGWLLKNHGPGSMRLDYRAKVGFHPNDSLTRHWKVYRRIHKDRDIVYGIRGFEEYAAACPLKLDWKYILRSCSLLEIGYFALYVMIVRIEKTSYTFIPYNESHWRYLKKEV